MKRLMMTVGCAAITAMAATTETNKVGFAAKVKSPEEVVATWWDGPRMRPGVALVVQAGSIAQQTTMNVTVDQNGNITLPPLLKEPIFCDGFTLAALKQRLVRTYSSYYRQPMVTVTFAPYDGKGVSPWGTVTVLGEVCNPGSVNMPEKMDLTVTKVLQAAGGCKPSADKTRIRVTQCDKYGHLTRTFVNIDEIGKGDHVGKTMPLRPGDVVWVPMSWY